MRLEGRIKQAGTLLSLLAHHPTEALQITRGEVVRRADNSFRRSGHYEALEWPELLPTLSVVLQGPIGRFLGEAAAAEMEFEINEAIHRMGTHVPFPIGYNADLSMAHFCYALCRATKPTTVVETGVAYGVTSAFILRALAANGKGTLHSVDLPPLGWHAEDFVGCLIPDRLRGQWMLHRGASKRVLPSLLPSVGEVDIFIHDSQHTYRQMLWEFRTVRPYFNRFGILVADDVQGNVAFEEWTRLAKPIFCATVFQPGKGNICGICVFDERA